MHRPVVFAAPNMLRFREMPFGKSSLRDAWFLQQPGHVARRSYPMASNLPELVLAIWRIGKPMERDIHSGTSESPLTD